MGRNTTIGTEKKFIYNRTGYKWFKNSLGDDIAEPKNLKQANVDQKTTDENFNGIQAFQAQNGGAASGTTAAINNMITELGNIFEYGILGAGQTITTFAKTDEGIEVAGDATDNEGYEICQGNSAYAKHAYIAQTDRFYAEAKFKSSAVAGFDELVLGFRKVEALNAALTSYTDYCGINLNAGTVNINSAVGGTDSTTIATDTIANDQYLIARLEYDDRVGLQRAIALANECKAQYNKHAVDVTMHSTADTADLITAADAIDLATLKTLITEELTKYNTHQTDAAQASPTYHPAQETGSDALASTSAPTTLALCMTRLNDLKAKFNAHEADATSHTLKSLHPVALHDAGCVTFKIGKNTVTLVEPSSFPGYAFTDALTLIPFFRVLRSATAAGSVELMSWKVGTIE